MTKTDWVEIFLILMSSIICLRRNLVCSAYRSGQLIYIGSRRSGGTTFIAAAFDLNGRDRKPGLRSFANRAKTDVVDGRRGGRR